MVYRMGLFNFSTKRNKNFPQAPPPQWEYIHLQPLTKLKWRNKRLSQKYLPNMEQYLSPLQVSDLDNSFNSFMAVTVNGRERTEFPVILWAISYSPSWPAWRKKRKKTRNRNHFSFLPVLPMHPGSVKKTNRAILCNVEWNWIFLDWFFFLICPFLTSQLWCKPSV